MFKPVLLTTLALALSASAGLASAQTAAAPADAASMTQGGKSANRQARQQEEIAAGAASGQLNAKETQRMEKKQARINKMQQKAGADGQVSGKERHKLKAAQKAANHDIHQNMKDGPKATPAASQ